MASNTQSEDCSSGSVLITCLEWDIHCLSLIGRYAHLLRLCWCGLLTCLHKGPLFVGGFAERGRNVGVWRGLFDCGFLEDCWNAVRSTLASSADRISPRRVSKAWEIMGLRDAIVWDRRLPPYRCLTSVGKEGWILRSHVSTIMFSRIREIPCILVSGDVYTMLSNAIIGFQ